MYMILIDICQCFLNQGDKMRAYLLQAYSTISRGVQNEYNNNNNNNNNNNKNGHLNLN